MTSASERKTLLEAVSYLSDTYISVEPFHLFLYLDEQAFRFNLRGGNDADRFKDGLNGVTGERIIYKALIGGPEAQTC